MEIQIQFQKEDFVFSEGMLRNYGDSLQCPLSRAVTRNLNLIERGEYVTTSLSNIDTYKPTGSVYINEIDIYDQRNNYFLRKYKYPDNQWGFKIANVQAGLFQINPDQQFFLTIEEIK